MTEEQLMDRVIEHGETLSAHEEQIKTLFVQNDRIEKLAESTQTLAESVKEMNAKVTNIDGRLDTIESDKSKKQQIVWQYLIGGVIGALVTYIMARILT